jgi:hypothetical protein
MNINLQVPIWTIEHVAAALHTSVDTAREHTYCTGFPAPKTPFAKNLWEREAVLAWFAGLPTRDRRSTKHVKNTTKAGHHKPAERTAPQPTGVPATKPTLKSYKPRSPR